MMAATKRKRRLAAETEPRRLCHLTEGGADIPACGSIPSVSMFLKVAVPRESVRPRFHIFLTG